MSNIFPLISSAFTTINKQGAGIQAIATSILIIITAYYAWKTNKMLRVMERQAGIMERQIISDIDLSNIFLHTNLCYRYVEIQPDKESIPFNFKLFFELRNKNSASGSIESPKLIINYGYDELPPIPPKTTNKDLGKTITLVGGGFDKVELEYEYYLRIGDTTRNKVSDQDKELLDCLKSNSNRLAYYLEYTNNLSPKNIRMKIDYFKLVS